MASANHTREEERIFKTIAKKMCHLRRCRSLILEALREIPSRTDIRHCDLCHDIGTSYASGACPLCKKWRCGDCMNTYVDMKHKEVRHGYMQCRACPRRNK